MAMALGIVFLIIIQLPCILNLLVWTMIIAIDVAFVYAGWYTKGVSATWEALGRPGNEALALYYGSYVLFVLAVLWLVTILFLRKRILLAVACVKEASRAISALPLMTLFPVCQVLCLFAFTVVWGVYMAYLASSGEITPSCVCPNDFGSHQMVPEIDANSGLDGSMMCDEGCFMFKELTYASNTKYAGL
jgi:choline transporter-like protein 2/4/5